MHIRVTARSVRDACAASLSATTRFRPALAVSIAALASAAVLAAMPAFWTVSTQADFLKGDVEDLSIDNDGRVFLGPSTTLVAETAAPFLWSIVAGADGTLWAGTGNEGKVLKIGKDGKAATFFDAPELEVHAIAAAPNNGLYVATSPDGKIYHVAADGTSRTLFDPEDKYIWALAVDRSGSAVRRHWRQGRHLQDHARRKGRPVLQDERHQRRLPRIRELGRVDCRYRIARTHFPNRCERKGLRAPRLAVQGNPCAARRRRRDALCSGRERQSAVRRGSDRRAAGDDGHRAASSDGGHDGDHLDRRGRHAGRAASNLRRLTPQQPRCGVQDQAEWPLGHLLGNGRRLAIRPADRARGEPARRHRPGGKDLPAGRRSGSRDAALARDRASGHGARCAIRPAASWARRAIPGNCFPSRPAPRGAAATNRTSATPGRSRRGA